MIPLNKIGIIGGLSYQSTIHYYREINEKVNKRAGGQTSAELLVRSVNFEQYYVDMRFDRWGRIGNNMVREALSLLDNGCTHIAIATNTIHKVADVVETALIARCGRNPLIHIGDCIADECKKIDAKNVIFLGTRFTMIDNFMDKRLGANGIKTVRLIGYDSLPRCGYGLAKVNEIIFDELCFGKVLPNSKRFLIDFVNKVIEEAPEKPDAIVLGCTELDMIIKEGDIALPIIDSTEAHVRKIAELALS